MFDRQQTRRSPRPRGVATVEFAVVLPVMVLILMGTIECTSMIFLQQSLEIVCYETVRAASRPQASSAEAIERGNDLIADRNIANCRITLKPKNLQSMSRGAIVTVTATAGSSANAFFPVTFFPKTLKAKAVMVRQ